MFRRRDVTFKTGGYSAFVALVGRGASGPPRPAADRGIGEAPVMLAAARSAGEGSLASRTFVMFTSGQTKDSANARLTASECSP